ncbi:putative necrosis-inducing factor-domain-containing protein [Hypoxylon sp. FL0890]|nr:putative necrosis-inducing factor-domain-containing protein [Hypoxylon sp. FL0890]
MRAIFTSVVMSAALGLATAIQLPGLSGNFIERRTQQPNGSSVTIYVQDSYKPSHRSIGKRFYETYHNDTSKYEICAETNFVDTSTLDSALTSDCSAIMTELRANPGFFETGDYEGNECNYLVVCGTCAFGVHRTDGLSSPVDIGSKDVVDNLNSAIIRFPIDGHVGATGNFTCNEAPINWEILRTT